MYKLNFFKVNERKTLWKFIFFFSLLLNLIVNSVTVFASRRRLSLSVITLLISQQYFNEKIQGFFMDISHPHLYGFRPPT